MNLKTFSFFCCSRTVNLTFPHLHHNWLLCHYHRFPSFVFLGKEIFLMKFKKTKFKFIKTKPIKKVKLKKVKKKNNLP